MGKEDGTLKTDASRRSFCANDASGAKKTAVNGKSAGRNIAVNRNVANRNTTEDQNTIFVETVADMKTLGVYKQEHEPLIKIYAQLREQYALLTDRYERSRYAIQTKSSGGKKKAPIVATLEGLRKDILAYSDRLCLNPKSLDAMTIKAAPVKTALESALERIGHAS